MLNGMGPALHGDGHELAVRIDFRRRKDERRFRVIDLFTDMEPFCRESHVETSAIVNGFIKQGLSVFIQRDAIVYPIQKPPINIQSIFLGTGGKPDDVIKLGQDLLSKTRKGKKRIGQGVSGIDAKLSFRRPERGADFVLIVLCLNFPDRGIYPEKRLQILGSVHWYAQGIPPGFLNDLAA